MNFVFGVASLRRRTGVYGLSRYGGGGDALLLRRTLMVFAHETGHILGMEHCVRYECLMNGSNSLAETDRQPAFLCPECHEKLRWNAGFDPRKRYEALAGFFGREGLEEEAAFARRQAGK
jgi:archaemetzincin